MVPVQDLVPYLCAEPQLYPAAALVVMDFLLRHGHLDLRQHCSEQGNALQQYAELMELLRIGDILPSWRLC